MEQWTLELFRAYEPIAFFLSVLVNIIISVAGVLPSVFLTAANLTMFGLVDGMWISFIGEAVGATIAFLLYRFGFRRHLDRHTRRHPRVNRLLDVQGKEAFFLILGLRLLPFMPSGLVTLTAAIGRVGVGTFILASTIGKVPAIVIEGLSVYQVLQLESIWQGVAIGMASILFGLSWFFQRKRAQQNSSAPTQ